MQILYEKSSDPLVKEAVAAASVSELLVHVRKKVYREFPKHFVELLDPAQVECIKIVQRLAQHQVGEQLETFLGRLQVQQEHARDRSHPLSVPNIGSELGKGNYYFAQTVWKWHHALKDLTEFREGLLNLNIQVAVTFSSLNFEAFKQRRSEEVLVSIEQRPTSPSQLLRYAFLNYLCGDFGGVLSFAQLWN